MKKRLLSLAITGVIICGPALAESQISQTVPLQMASQTTQDKDQQELAQLAYEYAYSIDEPINTSTPQ